MITNNVIRKPSYEKKNIISFIGTLTDNQHLREIAKAFNNSLKKKVLPSDYILNITGKCCLSKQYSKALYNEIQGYNMIKKNIILNLNINGIASDILETIIKDSLICIRIDINREVLSTKVLHYIDLCKPIILLIYSWGHIIVSNLGQSRQVKYCT